MKSKTVRQCAHWSATMTLVYHLSCTLNTILVTFKVKSFLSCSYLGLIATHTYLCSPDGAIYLMNAITSVTGRGQVSDAGSWGWRILTWSSFSRSRISCRARGANERPAVAWIVFLIFIALGQRLSWYYCQAWQGIQRCVYPSLGFTPGNQCSGTQSRTEEGI